MIFYFDCQLQLLFINNWRCKGANSERITWSVLHTHRNERHQQTQLLTAVDGRHNNDVILQVQGHCGRVCRHYTVCAWHRRQRLLRHCAATRQGYAQYDTLLASGKIHELFLSYLLTISWLRVVTTAWDSKATAKPT